MNRCAKKVLEFAREHQILRINSENLIKAITDCGYEVKYFRPCATEGKAQQLFEILNIKEFADGEDAFTYADINNRIVFVSKTLSEKEKCIVLSHELGHIYLKHMCNKKFIAGQNIEQEKEANEFSHYLMNGGWFFKMCMFLNNYRGKIILSVIGVILTITILGYLVGRISSGEENNTYYVTENGEKYHEKGCKHLEDNNILKSGKRNKLEDSGYSPCGDCLGNLQ